jgi:signal transduction histidine kinase
VVRNLIDNATKFAYERTAVVVSVERLGPAGIRIRVSDQGVGIPLGQQQRIFERFYQVDPSRAGFAVRRGTGLGLAIVKHAVKLLGGNIGVESVWKQGTTMTVELQNCLPGGK